MVDGADGGLEEEGSLGPASPSTSSSPASTAELAAEGYRQLLAALCGQAVEIVSLAVRWARTRRRELPPGIWVATRDDQEAIGEPLARIAARHAPIAGKASTDLVDGLTAGIAATSYGLRNFEAEAEATAQPPVEEESRV